MANSKKGQKPVAMGLSAIGQALEAIPNNGAYYEMANIASASPVVVQSIKGKNKWGHRLNSQANVIDEAIWQGALNLNSLQAICNLPKARISLHLSHLASLGYIKAMGNGAFIKAMDNGAFNIAEI